jgi:hypothetical protein
MRVRWVLVGGLLLPGMVWAQAYEGTPCEGTGNAALKDLKVGSTIARLDSSLTGAFVPWSTSLLRAEGKPPAPPKLPEGEEDVTNQAAWTRDEWTCMYGAQRAMDNDPKTAWCEGTKDDGIGEVVLAHVDPANPVRIWGGLGKSPALYAANSRPRKVRVTLLQGKRGDISEVGVIFTDLVAIGQHEVELKDTNGYQDLPLPKATLDPNAGGTFVAIQILSVYRGAKYHDTCVCEIGTAG